MKHTRPTISIVVPCRNEVDYIDSCLRSIFQQEDVPGGIEVIVADGLSDDGTRELLDEIRRGDQRLKIIDNHERNTAHGMNAGIRASRGRYVAIMGAHNRYATDYLRSAVEVLNETGADNVGGSMRCEGNSPIQKAIAGAHHSAFSVGGARWHDADYEGPADTVFGGVYRREVFDRIGLLDEELVRNQDDEFNLRLTRSGGKIWQSPRLRSWYTPRASLTGLFQQYAQYGYWKVRVIQKHKLPASVRHLVPGCFVLSLVFFTVTSIVWPPFVWALVALVGAYSACNVIVSMLTAWKRGVQLLPLLPFVFATYHFAYGLGFILGVLDFVIRRRGPARAFTKLTRTAVGVKSTSHIG